jgi:predicted nucleotidyltransferase
MKITESVLDNAVETAKEYGATELILFGSGLDESLDARDIDLACRGVDGWKLYGLGAALEERLRMPVDLVPLDEPSRFGRWIEARGRRLL